MQRKKTNLMAALMLGAGVGSTALPFVANANIASKANIAEYMTNPAAIAQIVQADNVGAALDVNAQQTAVAAQGVNDRSLHTLAKQIAIEGGVQRAYKIQEAVENSTLGVGITPKLGCITMAEEKTHTSRAEISGQVSVAIAQSNAATYYKFEGAKRALRAKDHFENYCDLSEVAAGYCLQKPGTKSGISTDYGNIGNNLTLTDEQTKAGYSFTKNIIDPAKSDDSFCDDLLCKELAQSQGQYHTLGSMIQNSFHAQIQDSKAWDTLPGGVQPIKVEQLGALSEAWDGKIAHPDSGVTGSGGGGNGSTLAALNAMNIPDALKPLIDELLALASKHESGGSYYSFLKGGDTKWNKMCGVSWLKNYPYKNDPTYDVTNMTLSQIFDRLEKHKDYTYEARCSYGAMYGVGKHGWVYITVLDIKSRDPEIWSAFKDRKFDGPAQEELAVRKLLLKREGFKEWLAGKGSLATAKKTVANVWSSFGQPGVCTPQRCKTQDGVLTGNRAKTIYEHTQQVYAVLDKMDAVIKQGHTIK